MDRGAWQATVYMVLKESDTSECAHTHTTHGKKKKDMTNFSAQASAAKSYHVVSPPSQKTEGLKLVNLAV